MPKPTVELIYHIVPVATSILTLAWANLLESSFLIEANQPLSTKQRDSFRYSGVLDSLHIACQKHLTQTLTCEIGMHTQGMQTDSVAIFVMADIWCELVVCPEIFRVVHRVIRDEIGG